MTIDDIVDRVLNPPEKYHKFILIGYAVIFISVICYWISEGRKADKKNLDIEFSGVVKQINYDIKQYPTILLGDSSYYIGAGHHTDHQIEIGDSIIKKRGSDIYKLIKHSSHKIIEFNK